MDAAKSQSNQKPSKTTTSSGEYNSAMDHMSSSVALRSINNPASLYLANEMSPDSVMSELNMYRPTTTSLPLWNGTSTVAQGMNYSIIATPGATNGTNGSNGTHAEQDSVTSNGTKPGSSSSSYDIFQGGSGDDTAAFQLSPKASYDCSNISNHESHSSDDLDADEEHGSLPKRKKRTPVPDERKDAKYWARRRKNNDAAKRSRDMRRKKLDVEIKSARDAITENQKLKQEIDVLKAEINSLRRLLKDANTTLSLWIRARQAAEPNVQVPPMLRGSNSLFVNFPVSTST